MFGWFHPKCPVDPAVKAWIEHGLTWLVGQFGWDRLLYGPVVLPTEEFFPDPYDGSADDVRRLLTRVCQYMDVDPAKVAIAWSLAPDPSRAAIADAVAALPIPRLCSAATAVSETVRSRCGGVASRTVRRSARPPPLASTAAAAAISACEGGRAPAWSCVRDSRATRSSMSVLPWRAAVPVSDADAPLAGAGRLDSTAPLALPSPCACTCPWANAGYVISTALVIA
jgi:hypothetical protein